MKTILVTLLLFTAPVLAANPYISVGGSFSMESIAAPPDITAAHPVDRVEITEKGRGLGPSVRFGYQWSAWYVEAGWTGLGRFSHEVTQQGTEADGTQRSTSSIREEEADTIEAKIGLLVPLTRRVTLYAEGGAHRYSNSVTLSEKSIERDAAGNIVAVTTSDLSADESKDSDFLYGAGIMFALPGTDAVKIGVTHYRGLDRTVATFALHFGF